MQAAIKLATGNISRETQKAIGLDVGDYSSLVWLPKSQIEVFANHNEAEYARHYIITMPIWLAKAKGFWGYNSFGETICRLVNEGDIIEIAKTYKKV